MNLKIPWICFFIFCLSNGIGHAETECVEGNCTTGKGKLIIKDGKGSMEGEFWEGMFISGKVIKPNGEIYEGFFKDNELVQGTRTYPNGLIQSGKFQSSILVDGVITYPNGTSRKIKMKAIGKRVPVPQEWLAPPPK